MTEKQETRREIYCPPSLGDLEEGEEVDALVNPNTAGPGNPIRAEFRRYYRRDDRLFYYVLTEVR